MLEEAQQTIEHIRAGLATKAASVNLENRKVLLAELEEKSNAPGLWDDPAAAQDLMRKIAAARDFIAPYEELDTKTSDVLELLELAKAEEDAELAKEIESEVREIQEQYSTLERALLFSGEYDANNAIFAVNAGAGGTEAQDWAQMLVRAYLRWVDQHDFEIEVLEENPGEEAGLKGFSAIIKGTNAYGLLKAEAGVHRLVRISPFNSAGKRMTSFASVDVVPEIEADDSIEIDPDDLRIDTFRASSAGGQNVQKNETAIRITHLPTGIVAQCQNERSQGRNKDVAMKVLKSRLLEKQWREQQEEIARVRGEKSSNEWGSQIRSYVFQPYQMVKDLRTGYETGNISAVMDGDFDGFIYAYLEMNAGR
jgi:peptide chain release factor 2